MDNLKESLITNDNLQLRKRTNLNVYLCPLNSFTLKEALDDLCPASVVKNITNFQNCHFCEVEPMLKHKNVHDAH